MRSFSKRFLERTKSYLQISRNKDFLFILQELILKSFFSEILRKIFTCSIEKKLFVSSLVFCSLFLNSNGFFGAAYTSYGIFLLFFAVLMICRVVFQSVATVGNAFTHNAFIFLWSRCRLTLRSSSSQIFFKIAVL